jgi:uncharacterized protein YndB with AHSA1/START domain
MTDTKQISWPPHYDPARCPIHVRNELAITATPETVWAWLVRASLWPSWYPNSSNVRFLTGSPPDLARGTRFQWKTFGVTIVSTVLEFVPTERLAWDAHAAGVDAYHAWLVTPAPEGCAVLTEETQHGWMARLGKLFMPNRMYRYHQIWLEGLRTNAAKGMPAAG